MQCQGREREREKLEQQLSPDSVSGETILGTFQGHSGPNGKLFALCQTARLRGSLWTLMHSGCRVEGGREEGRYC